MRSVLVLILCDDEKDAYRWSADNLFTFNAEKDWLCPFWISEGNYIGIPGINNLEGPSESQHSKTKEDDGLSLTDSGNFLTEMLATLQPDQDIVITESSITASSQWLESITKLQSHIGPFNGVTGRYIQGGDVNHDLMPSLISDHIVRYTHDFKGHCTRVSYAPGHFIWLSHSEKESLSVSFKNDTDFDSALSHYFASSHVLENITGYNKVYLYSPDFRFYDRKYFPGL